MLGLLKSKQMKKVLIVTGKDACEKAGEVSAGFNVHVCAVDVAALLTPQSILDELSRIDLPAVSLILVPGYVRGDVSIISKKLGIPCYKGTKNILDLPRLLKSIDSIKLSTTVEADSIISLKSAKDAKDEILKHTLDDFKFKVGTLPVGGTQPFKIIAEIPDAPLLTNKQLKSQAKYLAESGASIVDVGMVAGEDNCAKITDMIKTIRDVIKIPISVDSLDANEILASHEPADLILSIGAQTIDLTKKIKCPIVLVPQDALGTVPNTAAERVSVLEELIEIAQANSFNNYIVDPILNPQVNGVSDSLLGFKLFRERHPDVLMMMGAGNVTELMDVDSPGVNAVLGMIAADLKIDFVFTTEASNKTRGCVRELAILSEMMFLASLKNQPPKDLGIDLLRLKDKKHMLPIVDKNARKITPINVSRSSAKLDSSSFKIYVEDARILVVGYAVNKPVSVLKGVDASSVYSTLCAKHKISSLHAAYLGAELAKAEIALKIGKNYVQDETLF